MYSRCIFCVAPLGRNESVESFPVGRRLAYDGGKGRLWVVCRSCERWNLTPLEERWEAIEECERHFRETRLRVSTENIGLARLHEGLELVRIGEPRRPEFAGWRYGDQFGRRRRRHLVRVAAGAGIAGGLAVGAWALGVGGFALWLGSAAWARLTGDDAAKPVTDIPAQGGRTLRLDVGDVRGLQILAADATDGWRLTFWKDSIRYALTGEVAVRLAGAALPHLNRAGASAERVQRAVREIEALREPTEVFHRVAARIGSIPSAFDPDTSLLARQPLELRLAMEMAAHEDAERRALDGELALLERRWKEAEELAAISDDLALPGSVERTLARLRSLAQGKPSENGPGSRLSDPNPARPRTR